MAGLHGLRMYSECLSLGFSGERKNFPEGVRGPTTWKMPWYTLVFEVWVFEVLNMDTGITRALWHRGAESPLADSAAGGKGPLLFCYDRALGTPHRGSLTGHTLARPPVVSATRGTGEPGPLPSLSRVCSHSGCLVRRHQH